MIGQTPGSLGLGLYGSMAMIVPTWLRWNGVYVDPERTVWTFSAGLICVILAAWLDARAELQRAAQRRQT